MLYCSRTPLRVPQRLEGCSTLKSTLAALEEPGSAPSADTVAHNHLHVSPAPEDLTTSPNLHQAHMWCTHTHADKHPNTDTHPKSNLIKPYHK